MSYHGPGDFCIVIGNKPSEKKNQRKIEEIEYLKSWYITKSARKSARSSKELKMYGQRCDEKKTTVSGKNYHAGIIVKTIKKDLIRTTNGVYRLTGPPIPKNKISERFHKYWIWIGGFPKQFCTTV